MLTVEVIFGGITMCMINVSDFDKIFSFVVDDRQYLIELNDQMELLINSFCGENYQKKHIKELSVYLPEYMKELLLFCENKNESGLVVKPIAFDNGLLSIYCHTLNIGGAKYKYVIGTFYSYSSTKGVAYHGDIIDKRTGLYNKSAMDVVQCCDGCALIISVYSGVNNIKKLDNDIVLGKFSGLLKELFVGDDTIFQFDDNWFAIARNVKRNNFHKDILKLKKAVYSSFRDIHPDVWFSYKVEQVILCDLTTAVTRGVNAINNETMWGWEKGSM